MNRLLPCERALIRNARAGRETECSTLDAESLSERDDRRYRIRGKVIRDLLLGRHGRLDPFGIVVRGARVVGEELNLQSVRFPVKLELIKCCLDMPIVAHDARMPCLRLDESWIWHLHADRIKVDGSVFLNGIRAKKASEWGAVRLLGAHIAGNLECDDTKLHNEIGPAIHAEGIRIDQTFRFHNAEASTTCDTGTINLVNAHIGGDLHLYNTKLRNENGPVLNAERLSVEGSVLFCRSFVAKAKSAELATIHLAGARIGARLDFGPGREHIGLAHGQKPDDATKLCPAEIINQHSSGLAIDLRSASVNDLNLPAETVCQPTKRSCSTGNKLLATGLHYNLLSAEAERDQWTHWFNSHTPLFQVEPYQHLAALKRAGGHEADARQILIEQENERYRRHRRDEPLTSRLWHWVKQVTIGYGYRPGRALYGLACVLAVALCLTLVAKSQGSIHHPMASGPTGDCSWGEAVRLAADLSVPLINASGRLRCDFESTGVTAQIGMVAGFVLQLLGWAFTTLFVAGFSGVIRKP